MAGHSKWANIKHRKAAQDASRGKLFTKLIRELVVAAKTGGPAPEDNPRLRTAIDKALGANMRRDTIDKAIQRGAGAGEGENYEQITYEGYGAGGVAVMVECLTDNRNRAAAEVRTAITRNGGNPADPGSVSYLFGRKGVVLVTKTEGLTEDDVLLAVLDAGAEDVNDLEETFEVVCEATDTHAVRLACTDAGFDVQSADIAWMPTLSVPLEDEAAVKVLKLVDALEDLDDVQNVWANFDISDEVFERVG